MNKKPRIVTRGKIVYYLYDEKVVVGVGCDQWVSYNQYDNWNRQGIAQFINIILRSKETEYANATDQMSLAVQCGIRGSGTRKPEDAE